MTPLLQLNPSTFWAQGQSGGSNSNWWMWALAIAVVLILFVAVGQSARNTTPKPKGGFSRRNWRRGARAFGLDEEEIHFLEGYARQLGIENPDATLRNKTRLEVFFKQVYHSIEKNSESETLAEERKARLFELRERLARRDAAGPAVHSTRQLGRNIPLSFITPNEENYPTVVVRSDQQGLYVEPVVDPLGDPIRFRRGTKLSCFFYTRAHQGYQFATRVAGFQTLGERVLMVLAHNDGVTPLPSRRHQRRETRVPCMYFRVAVNEGKKGGKGETSARVENIGMPGVVTDLSAGGLALQAVAPLQPGDYLKVVLDPGGGKQAAFGKVLRLNKLRTGTMMHVQFVKISRRSLNAILSYVHGYTD